MDADDLDFSDSFEEISNFPRDLFIKISGLVAGIPRGVLVPVVSYDYGELHVPSPSKKIPIVTL